MTYNKTELETYTTTQLIELQDDILEQIEELKEKIDDGERFYSDGGYGLEDILWGYEYTATNIEEILNQRIPANA